MLPELDADSPDKAAGHTDTCQHISQEADLSPVAHQLELLAEPAVGSWWGFKFLLSRIGIVLGRLICRLARGHFHVSASHIRDASETFARGFEVGVLAYQEESPPV